MFRVVTVIHHTDLPSQITVSVALCKVKMMIKYKMKKKKNINLVVYSWKNRVLLLLFFHGILNPVCRFPQSTGAEPVVLPRSGV